MDSILKEKVVIVTGSSRGIGREIALKCALSGADVIVTFKENKGSAENTCAEITALGRRALCFKADVTQQEDVKNIVLSAVEKFGKIDILINNAGLLQQKPFEKISEMDWNSVMAVNTKGTFFCSQEVLPVMKEQGQGCIINIASTGGQLGGTLAVHYSASKAAVICFTKSLARVSAPYNIRVNCIAPGLIATEMTEAEINSDAGKAKIEQVLLKRPGLPEEVANVSVFLASSKASYITGQTINVDGGLYLG